MTVAMAHTPARPPVARARQRVGERPRLLGDRPRAGDELAIAGVPGQREPVLEPGGLEPEEPARPPNRLQAAAKPTRQSEHLARASGGSARRADRRARYLDRGAPDGKGEPHLDRGAQDPGSGGRNPEPSGRNPSCALLAREATAAGPLGHSFVQPAVGLSPRAAMLHKKRRSARTPRAGAKSTSFCPGEILASSGMGLV